MPSPDDEYLLYQTLVGAWPIELLGPDEPAALPLERFRERINAYMIKAVREAKQMSSNSTPLQSCLRSVIAAPCYLTKAFTLH